MKTLLTHGYYLEQDQKEQKIMRPYPPLGLLYVSAYLEQGGIAHEIFDSTFSSEAQLFQFLTLNRPRYLAIYVNLMTKLNVLRIIQFVRRTPELSQAVIILGGPEVRNSDLLFLEYGANYIVIGEGEETCLELIQFLDGGKSTPHQIPGLAFLHSGQIVRTPERLKIKDIDQLPVPNRSKINLNKYLGAWKEFHGINAVSVSTMRGCPYTCKWCSRAVYGLSYRRRSPRNVVDELKLVMESYQPDTLWFVDDVFTISHKWLTGFKEELKNAGLQISYECITRADRLNEEAMDMLRETGCFRVWIGAESGSQKILDSMDRRVQVGQVRKMIHLARKKGIQAGTFIMLGYPGETEEDINLTISHLKESNPDHFTITLAYPIRGTELFTELGSHMHGPIDWEIMTDRQIDFDRTYSRRYYDFALKRVNNEVQYYQRVQRQGFDLHSAKMKLKSIAAKAGMRWYRTFDHPRA